jgi:hypothetical protein
VARLKETGECRYKALGSEGLKVTGGWIEKISTIPQQPPCCFCSSPPALNTSSSSEIYSSDTSQPYSLLTYKCNNEKELITYYPRGVLDKDHPEIIGNAMCSGFIRMCPITATPIEAAGLVNLFNCAFSVERDFKNKEARLYFITKGL